MACKISIIVAAYNLENYIAEALESCLSQELADCKEMEIIIGDDGSKDNTLAIIKNYQRRYPDIIKYFVVDREATIDTNIPIIRQSNVFRKGLELCTGEYIQFLDGDDLLLDKKKLDFQSDFLNKNKSYGSCYTDYRMLYEDTNTEQDVKIEYNPSENLFWVLSYAPASCFLFRNNIKNYLLENIISDTGITFSGTNIGNFKHIDRVSFGYRKRAGSMSDLKKLQLYTYEMLVAQDCLKYKKKILFVKAKYYTVFKYVYEHYQEFIESDLYIRAKAQTKNGIFFNKKSNKYISDKKYLIILIIESFFINNIFRCIRKVSMLLNESKRSTISTIK